VVVVVAVAAPAGLLRHRRPQLSNSFFFLPSFLVCPPPRLFLSIIHRVLESTVRRQIYTIYK
jgi:hypothetical protein